MSQIEQLQALALQVVQDRRKNNYSVSRIYNAYNLIFNKRESPQTCASCLLKRAKEIEKWYEDSLTEPLTPLEPSTPVEPEGGEPEADEEPAPEADEAREDEIYSATNKKGDAVTVVYNADAETAKDAEGKDLPAGTYQLDNGDKIAVQVGGKATYKADLA